MAAVISQVAIKDMRHMHVNPTPPMRLEDLHIAQERALAVWRASGAYARLPAAARESATAIYLLGWQAGWEIGWRDANWERLSL